MERRPVRPAAASVSHGLPEPIRRLFIQLPSNTEINKQEMLAERTEHEPAERCNAARTESCLHVQKARAAGLLGSVPSAVKSSFVTSFSVASAKLQHASNHSHGGFLGSHESFT